MAGAMHLCSMTPSALQAMLKGVLICPGRQHRAVTLLGLCSPLWLSSSPQASFTTSSKFQSVKDESTKPFGGGLTKNLEKSTKTPPQPFSVFSAGAAKRRSELLGNQENRTDTRLSRLKGMEVPTQPLQAEEWNRLRLDYYKPANFIERMMELMITSNSNLNIAKSLLSFAAKDGGGIGYGLLIKYLALCVHQQQTLEIYDVYDIMRARFKTMETSAYGLFIKGFSQSDRWQESVLLLEALKKTLAPTKKNYGDCIQGALQHGDTDLAWALYSEMLRGGVLPLSDTLKAFFDAGRTLGSMDYNSKLFKVLEFLRDHQIYPGESFALSVKSWFESIPEEKWQGRLTEIHNSGECKACRHDLESIQLSSEEYSTLKDAILTEVIQGEDTFRKTTPLELQEFQDFVKKHQAFDIVMDGLNVASLTGKGCRSQILLDVVSNLAQKNLRILVLGRKHMLNPSRNWDRHHMATMQRKAACFFTDNLSEDDPFLLYATLNSGNQCKFITRDLMRDHKACLADGNIQRLFFKWQRGHQLVIPFYNPGKKVVFQAIPSYDTVVQTTGDTWHVPYDEDDVQRCTYEVPRKWLCLKRTDRTVPVTPDEKDREPVKSS